MFAKKGPNSTCECCRRVVVDDDQRWEVFHGICARLTGRVVVGEQHDDWEASDAIAARNMLGDIAREPELLLKGASTVADDIGRDAHDDHDGSGAAEKVDVRLGHALVETIGDMTNTPWKCSSKGLEGIHVSRECG